MIRGRGKARDAVLLLAVAIGLLARLAAPALAQDLRPIPEPNLDDVESAVVDQLSKQRAATLELAVDAQADRAQLALEMGKLGQLYILYELLEAAEPALVNAESLTPEDPRWPYLLATVLQEQRRLDEAGARLERVLELDSTYLPAIIRLGDIESAAGRTAEARSWYEAALKVSPDSPAANWGLGQIAYGSGDSEAAVRHFEAILEIQPEASAVHYPLALAYRDLGDIEKAREHLSQRGEINISRIDPLVDGLTRLVEGASLYMVRGNQAFSRGRLDTAVAAYRSAVEADPDNIIAREALSSALTSSGDPEGALAQIQWLIDNGHARATTYYNLATLRAESGQLEEALADYRRALEIDPDLIDAQYNIGLVLEAMGRDAEALEHYARVLDLDPQDTAVRIRQAAMTARQGNPGEAERALIEVLSTDPNNAEALLALAAVLAGDGRTEAALERYDQVAVSGSSEEDQARALYESGRLLLGDGRTQQAEALLQRTVTLMPQIPEARMTWAVALARLGRFDRAAQEYETVLTQDASLLTARHGLVIALLLAENDQRAAEILESSRAMFPQDAQLTHLQVRVLATSRDPSVRDAARALPLAQNLFTQQPNLDFGENVAMALAALGRFPEAIQMQTRVVERARLVDSPTLATAEDRLRTYQAGEAVFAPWAPDDSE